MVNLNRLSSRSRAIQGGGRPIFKQNAWNEQVWMGSILAGNLKAGDVIFAGDFGYFEYKSRKSYPLRQFVLAQDLAAEDTDVYFLNTDYTHNMRTGLFITAEPTSATSTGKSVACTTMVKTTLNDVDVYKVTITAGSLGTGTKGDVYVEAAEAGENVAPLLTKVNVIFDDNFIAEKDMAELMEDNFNNVLTITPKMHCTIIADLAIVPKIAPANKSAVEEFYQL